MLPSNFHLILYLWTFLSISINKTTTKCFPQSENSAHFSDWVCENMKLISSENPFEELQNFNISDTIGFFNVSGEFNSSILSNFTDLRNFFIADSHFEKFEFYNSKIKSIMFIRIVVPDETSLAHCCHNLEKLVLKNNTGLNLEEGGFAGLRKLKAIDIKISKIRHINKNTFKGLNKLKILSLVNSSVETIEENSFTDLANLRELYIEDNNLTFIHQKALEPLEQLTSLTIYGDNLEPLPLELFRNQKKITEIGLPFKTWRDVDIEKMPEMFPQLSFFSYKKDSLSRQEKEMIKKKLKKLTKLLFREQNT